MHSIGELGGAERRSPSKGIRKQEGAWAGAPSLGCASLPDVVGWGKQRGDYKPISPTCRSAGNHMAFVSRWRDF